MNSDKRAATLLEVLIAMALTMVVLMTLTYFYRQVSMIGAQIDDIRAHEFYLRYVENRLAAVLTNAVGAKDKAGDYFFSVVDDPLTLPGSQSLIFTYFNGVDEDNRYPHQAFGRPFSGNVLGRLYVDKQGRFMLAYWPSPKRKEKEGVIPMKKEMLMEGVSALEFEFFIAPDKKRNETAPVSSSGAAPALAPASTSLPEPEPKGDWRREPWLKEFKQLPTIVKVIVKTAKSPESPLIFVFPIANTKAHIIYE